MKVILIEKETEDILKALGTQGILDRTLTSRRSL